MPTMPHREAREIQRDASNTGNFCTIHSVYLICLPAGSSDIMEVDLKERPSDGSSNTMRRTSGAILPGIRY